MSVATLSPPDAPQTAAGGSGTKPPIRINIIASGEHNKKGR